MKLSRAFWWQRRGVIACLWLPVSALFMLLVGLRRAAYRWGWLKSENLPVPVIVVGNLAVGGSGKTPVVIWLAQALAGRGFRPGILSRGYGGRVQGPCPVVPDSQPEEVGDEPVLLALRTGCPVWIGRDRVAVGQALLSSHPAVDVLITDDGLQHLRLRRTAEVVVMDDAMTGNGWMLPAGPLREPLSRAASASLVIGNGGLAAPIRARLRAVPYVAMRLVPGEFHRLGDPCRRRGADTFHGQPLRAIAGIGHPRRFFATLEALGLHPAIISAFPDHHAYTAADLATEAGTALLMTEKDAVKCRALAPADSWVLPVEAQIDAAALDVLLEHLHGSKTA